MSPVEHHILEADVSFDGGNLDCGGGLLLLIRRHIDPMEPGGLLEIRSTDSSVEGDLPAWCRLTGNEFISWTKHGPQRSYLVCKGPLSHRAPRKTPLLATESPACQSVPTPVREAHLTPSPVPPIPTLSVMGIGSWPRPNWMLAAIHDRLEGRLADEACQRKADDAVRLSVAAQLRAGVQVVTDGEQRRDSYASFVGMFLENCQLIPLTDLTAMVDDPKKFENELRALDVPAAEVRHPVVFGRLSRRRPMTGREFELVRALTDKPQKIALPGPYLLTRTMWLDCLRDRPYQTREDLAKDVARVLREELQFLIEAGVALVQFDEPVLTEVVFTGAKNQRSFMCGALSEKKSPEHELGFAAELLNQVIDGLPRERIGLHICRGNWTRDESAVLSGDYRALMSFFQSVRVGILFLELCTPRAGELQILKGVPNDIRIGVGVVNQKLGVVEPVSEIAARAGRAINLLGKDRVLLTPDCGFATFADNPVSSSEIAERKLHAIVQARERLI